MSKPIDADELRYVLGAAVRPAARACWWSAARSCSRCSSPRSTSSGIEYQWELTGAAAARVCAERRFEVALVDVGIRNPQAVIQALDLRGRRLRRAAILFSDGARRPRRGSAGSGWRSCPVDQAAAAVLAALRGERRGGVG